MYKTVVLDTSALLKDGSIIDKLINVSNIVILKSTVKEIERIYNSPKNEDEYYSSKLALSNIEKYIDAIEFDEEYNNILEYSQRNLDVSICTNSVSVKISSNKLNIPVVSIIPGDSLYKGYVQYELTALEYCDYWENKEKYYDRYITNQYIILHDIDNDKYEEFRFDGEKLVELSIPSRKTVKPKNSLQKCALDMLFNDNISTCVLAGKVGSGKSFLAMKSSFSQIDKNAKSPTKLVAIREPRGEGAEIGFLPGDVSDKTENFFLPLADTLEEEYFKLQNMIRENKLEYTIPYFCKGRTFKDSFIVVDEAEDLTERQIRLIGTRVGEGSKIIWTGDHTQAITDSRISNPLVKMCERLKGDPLFGCIFLEDDVRSEVSKLYSQIFQNE